MSRWGNRAEGDMVGTLRYDHNGRTEMVREERSEDKSTGDRPENCSRSGEVIPSDT